jgi:hypothetical protein
MFSVFRNHVIQATAKGVAEMTGGQLCLDVNCLAVEAFFVIPWLWDFRSAVLH